MKTAQALGIKCVAVFSEADRYSMHVKMVSLSPFPRLYTLTLFNIAGRRSISPGSRSE